MVRTLDGAPLPVVDGGVHAPANPLVSGGESALVAPHVQALGNLSTRSRSWQSESAPGAPHAQAPPLPADEGQGRIRSAHPAQARRASDAGQADEGQGRTRSAQDDPALRSRRREHTVHSGDSLTHPAGPPSVSPDAAPRRVEGVIEHSLYRAGRRAGLSERLVMELAGIFAWDIDFILDIRKGDRFSVLCAQQYRQGSGGSGGEGGGGSGGGSGGKGGGETILAAEFRNRDRVLRALRYVDAAGRADYFTPTGQAMRKAFIRAPVAFTRVSSSFDLRRRHPILNRIRAHRGVDYAAPVGAPVQATGDGVIEFIGRKGEYGRTILIRHADRYQTLYAHLSRYARGLARGSRVRQGQRIGYVGQSGLATGPHLHYEFRVRGVHRDPLKVSLPRAPGLDGQALADFRARTAPLLAALAGGGQPPSAHKARTLQQSAALPAPANDG